MAELNGDNFWGQTVGNFLNQINGTWQNQQFNAQEAEKAYERQKEMAQNQYQWAVQDMEAAGLNPAMMYASGGSGNTAPSAPSAAGTNTHAMNIVGGISNLINAITNAVKAKEIDSKVADAMYQRAEAMTKNAQTNANYYRLHQKKYIDRGY